MKTFGCSNSKLAILSYHSWDIHPDTLIEDVTSLRKNGWIDLCLDEACSFIAGTKKTGGRFFLITSDDGSAQDEKFVDALRQVNCPGVLFVNIGTIPTERLPFYRQLAESQDIAVQDHGQFHRKQFVSSQVCDYVTHESYLGGLEHLNLEPGMPLFASASELASQRFIPNPEAMALAAETAKLLPPRTANAERSQIVESALIRKKLGHRRFGRFYLRGKFERAEEFSQRVFHYIADGKKEFEEKLGRSPEYFAYPWWQGSWVADTALQKLGYKGSFSGTGYLQGRDGRLFGIPRIPVESKTLRPLSLENLTMRPMRERTFISFAKSQCKAVMGMR